MSTDPGEKAYSDYLRSQGLDDAEVRAHKAYEDYKSGKTVGAPGKTWGDVFVDKAVGPALDYTSSMGRGAVNGLLQAVSGKNLGINFQDVLNGKTPQNEELLRRAG